MKKLELSVSVTLVERETFFHGLYVKSLWEQFREKCKNGKEKAAEKNVSKLKGFSFIMC